jgi:hypothetical protein
MKIRPVGTEILLANGHTEMTKVIFAKIYTGV